MVTHELFLSALYLIDYHKDALAVYNARELHHPVGTHD